MTLEEIHTYIHKLSKYQICLQQRLLECYQNNLQNSNSKSSFLVATISGE